MNFLRIAIIGPFLMAFFIALATTPLAMKIAPRIGAIDIPKDGRRMHTKAIPRFGGMAIFLGAEIAMLVFLHDSPRIMAAVFGGACIYALGVVDDLKNLDAKLKFAVQMLIAIMMYMMGLKIEFISRIGMEENYHLGAVLCFVVTVLWIVGITNTINLIDGLDGLAAGVAAIAALSIAYVAYIHGTIYGFMIVCIAMMALAGGCLGFLPYNFSPAKIFMGDGGSLYLGFMLATMSVVGPLKQSTVITIIVPVFVMGIPIFDTFFAIFRRLINHKPIMQADRGHLHHRLIESGYGQRRAVLMIYGICAIMGMAAVLVSRELYKDAVILLIIDIVYVYVFLTDPNHKMPRIKAVNIEKEEAKKRKN